MGRRHAARSGLSGRGPTVTRRTPRLPAPTLADRARELQALAAVGSNRRKAAGVAAVMLDASRSGTVGARRLLARHRLPAELKRAVLEVLAELEQPQEGDTDV